MILNVFPTSRSIRKLYDKFSNEFLPKSITMDEFEKRSVIVKNMALADNDKRILLLKKAALFKSFEELKIPKDYLSFLKSSKFLFGFLEELALEFVNIDDINSADTYAEYEKHLKILKILLKNYKNILKKEKYYDKITLPCLYELNTKYLKRFSKIVVYLDGYLNNYEMELLGKISKTVPLEIVYQTNIFSEKMIKKFHNLGIELEINKLYHLNFSEKKVLKCESKSFFVKEINFYEVSNKLLQIGYVKKKIYDFLKEGIKPEKVAVITPDEKFAELIEKFDTQNIFNFATGYSYDKSSIYKRVQSVYSYFEDKNYENRYRIKRYFKNYEEFDEYLFKKFNEVNFYEFMMKFVFDTDKSEEISIFKNELFKFKRVENEFQNSSLKEAIYLFLSRLKENRLDDKSGGKITVMGVLESRLMKYDGVIVVDFNEDTVPKKSSKDIFLNTSIRKHTGLPTIADRENLQKNYYYKLFLNAKKVAICAVLNENEKPSKFLDELNIKKIKKDEFEESFLKKIVLKNSKSFNREFDNDLKLEYDFKNFTFSATSFKIFLECKRRFYYQYIKKINEEKIPSIDADEKTIGEKIHYALKELYQRYGMFQNKKELQEKLFSLLSNEKEQILAFKLDIWKEKLKNFINNEIKRFEEGYRFYKAEMSLSGKIEGISIKGIIDRVDKKDNSFVLLDYKSGKIDITTLRNIEKTTNFQMEFYYILFLENIRKDICEAGFYDLGRGVIVKEDLLEEKVKLLKEKFKQLHQKEYNFSMSEDTKRCRYCPYVMLCGRDET